MTKLTIPAVGTEIPFTMGDAALSKDERTWICRISFNEFHSHWEIVSPDARRGLLVFMNDAPDEFTTHIKISAIQSSGKAAYADSVDHDWGCA